LLGARRAAGFDVGSVARYTSDIGANTHSGDRCR